MVNIKNIKIISIFALFFILVIFILGNYFVKLNLDGQKKLFDEKKTRIDECIATANSWYKSELNNISVAGFATLEKMCGSNNTCKKNQESTIQTSIIKMATDSKKVLDKRIEDCIKLEY